MEIGERIKLVWFSLAIFLPFQYAQAFSKTDPTDNANLSPIWAWKSAYYCTNRTAPSHCSPKGQLTFSGIVDVPANETGEYCSSGCSAHALDVLKCIYLCKEDFWFHNNATVHVLNTCKKNNTAISTVDYKSSGIKVLQKMYVPFVASLSTLAFIAPNFMRGAFPLHACIWR